MNKGISVSVILLSFMLCVSCGSNEGKTTSSIIEAAENIDVKTFADFITAGQKVIIDVRTPAEFAEGHIEGAKLINVLQANFNTKINKLDKKNTSYLVYCAVGGRSGTAMKKMKTAGFKSVYNLATGFNGWKAAGQKITK